MRIPETRPVKTCQDIKVSLQKKLSETSILVVMVYDHRQAAAPVPVRFGGLLTDRGSRSFFPAAPATQIEANSCLD
jgi:hypothetical protein